MRGVCLMRREQFESIKWRLMNKLILFKEYNDKKYYFVIRELDTIIALIDDVIAEDVMKKKVLVRKK